MSKVPIKVIVDTSVWIDFFRGKLSPLDREAILLLLEAEEVVITDIIKHEILIGATSASQFKDLEENLSALEELSIDSSMKRKFCTFGFELKQMGLLGKYTDTAIAFTAKHFSYPIYSFDRYFEKLAEKKIIQIFSPRSKDK